MSYEKSPIDDFFYNIYGYYPEKAGQSYELLVNAVLKITNNDSELKYNQFKEGIYSQQKYQLDGIKDNKESIEAKDYTIRNEKVGRPDIQKQEGGLIDLPYESGIFASATGYTSNAKKYAEGTYKNPNGKPIDLYDIHPSTEEDEEGRINTIANKIIAFNPLFDSGKFEAVFTKDSKENLMKRFPDGREHISKLDNIFNSDKSVFLTNSDLLKKIYNEAKFEDENDLLEGEQLFTNKYVLVDDNYYEISKIKYSIPVVRLTLDLLVEQDGKACLLVRDSDGNIDRILTDMQLKDVKFDNGNVIENIRGVN